MQASLPIIIKCYDLYKAIVQVNSLLQKRWRYSLGIGLEATVMECMEGLVMAKNAPKALKVRYLIQASGKLEMAQMKLRIMLELKLANETRIFQIQSMVSEIGRMLGGWIKAAQSR